MTTTDKLNQLLKPVHATGFKTWHFPSEGMTAAKLVISAIPAAQELYGLMNPAAVPAEVPRKTCEGAFIRALHTGISGLMPLVAGPIARDIEKVLPKDDYGYFYHQGMPVDPLTEDVSLEELFIWRGNATATVIYLWSDS